jgi:hypothetical protein
MTEPKIIQITVVKTVRQVNIGVNTDAPKLVPVIINKITGPPGTFTSINAYPDKPIPEDIDNTIIEEVAGTKKKLSLIRLYEFIKSKLDALFVAKVDGKGLSTEDYTTGEKQKLANIADGATLYTNEMADARVVAGITGKENMGVAAQLDQPVLENTKTYADNLVVGLWDDRGSFNAAVNTFPVNGGSGAMGTILKGDIWTISEEATDGPLKGYLLGSTIRAKVDLPGQAAENWATLEVGFGYVPENKYNKVETLSGSSTHQQYPTAKTVYDQLAGKQPIGNYLTPPDIAAMVDNNTALAYSIALS